MSVFIHIFLLLAGGALIYLDIIVTKQRFNAGQTFLRAKLNKANCSEKDFIAKLKMSILKSFLIRFAIVGLAGFAAYAFFKHIDRDLGTLGRLSGLEYLSLWVSTSIVAIHGEGVRS